MKRILFFGIMILSAAVWSMGCSKMEEELSGKPDGSHPGSVRFVFEPKAELMASRAMDEAQESEVRDVNLWLLNSLPGVVQHHYLVGSGSVILELPAGTYNYYALANAGTDLGELDAASPESLSLSLDPYTDFQQGDRLLMAEWDSFTVSGATTVTVPLVRCAAKVEFDLSIAPTFATKFTLTRVQVLDVPTLLHPFGDNRPENLANRTDYPAENAADGFHGIYYLPENLAGVNTAISDPRQRSRANAPKGAACFRIEGTVQGRKVDYFVYPGANVTTDFNLKRNHHYRIEAVITGANTVDTRVSTTEVALPAWNTQYYVGETVRSQLTLSCLNNADNWFDLSYELLSGNGTVKIDGQTQPQGVPFRLLDGGSSCVAEVTYSQADAGTAALRFTLKDRYGFSVEKELSTTFVNKGPTVTFEQEGDTLYGYEFAFLDLHIAQPGYTGSYKITVEGVARVYYDSDTPVTEFTLPACGDYLLKVSPARVGSNPFRITVTDEQGHSTQFISTVTGRTAYVQVWTEYTGGGLSQLTITVYTSCPVGEDINVSLEFYLSKLNMGGIEGFPTRIIELVKIYAGNTQTSLSPNSGSGYMGYVVKGDISIQFLSVTDSRDGLYHYEIASFKP